MSGIVRKKCCCDKPGCCYDPTASPSPTVTISFAGSTPCDEAPDTLWPAKLSAPFAGTFLLARSGFSNFPEDNLSCSFRYAGAYTAQTYDAHQNPGYGPNPSNPPTYCTPGFEEPSTVDDPVICSTDYIEIDLFSDGFEAGDTGTFTLWARLMKLHPRDCECGCLPFGDGPRSDFVEGFQGLTLFYATGIRLKFCGETIEVANQAACYEFGGYILCPDGWNNPNPDESVAGGGTAVITL